VLNANPGSRAPSRKPKRHPPVRRVGRRRSSRFDTTAQAAQFTRRRSTSRGKSRSLREALEQRLEQQRRNRRRRSRVRLSQYEATAPAIDFRKALVNPARSRLRLNGKLVFNVLFLALVGWGLIWLFVSERFYVSHIAISGNHRVSTEAILAASGIQGYSILWVNRGQVIDNILTALPPVKDVKLRYGLPNVVTVVVEERGDQVMWQVMSKRYWIDDQGFLHPAQGANEPKLVVKDVRPGLPEQVDEQAVIAAHQLVQLLPEQQTIEYAPLTGLRFTHSLGWVVYLGSGDDMARKVSLLRALEAQFRQEGAVQPSLVDLRFPDSPYYRFPGGGSGGM
jgi:cell division septal protein FtsQ